MYAATAKGVERLLYNGISMAHNGAWLFGKYIGKGILLYILELQLSILEEIHLDCGMARKRVAAGIWRTRNIWKIPVNFYL